MFSHDIIKLPGYFNAIYVSSRFKDIIKVNSFTGIGLLPIGLSDSVKIAEAATTSRSGQLAR